MRVTKRKLNASILSLTERYLLRFVKICGVFPFVYHHQTKRYVLPKGWRLVYIICVITFQIISTLIVLWLKIYRATIMTKAASKELAHLLFLVSVFTYQTVIFFIFWKLYLWRDEYETIVNSLNNVYQRFLKIGVDKYLEPVDHKLELMFGGIFIVQSLFTFLGTFFYIFSIYNAGLLEGLGLVEALSIVIVAPTVTYGILFFSATNLLVAHYVSVIRLRVCDNVRRLKRCEGVRAFEFEQICLDLSDQLGYLAQLQEQLHEIVQGVERLVGIPLAIALLNMFVLVVSNVRITLSEVGI